ncbi:MAG TPA: acyl-CoA thioesterase domain-containing protein [Caulobacteraceae bacterium]
MAEQPFFTRAGDSFQPTSASRGPWDPKSLHGRVIAGLMAAVIEARHGGEAYMPARLTVDMYRLPNLEEIEVTTRLVKDGYRLRLVEAEFISGGAPAALATCQLLRRTAKPAGVIWRPANWDAPAPDEIAPPADDRAGMDGMWAMKPISGAMGTVGPRRTWMAEVRPLIEGEALTPFVRAAVAADFASPFANAGDAGLSYINSDVSLYLHRLPIGEWIGFEVVNHEATDGVAIGECRLFDEEGAIGTSSVAALAQSRGMRA